MTSPYLKIMSSALESVSKPGNDPPPSVLRKAEAAKIGCLDGAVQRSKPSLSPLPWVSKRPLREFALSFWLCRLMWVNGIALI